MRISHLAMAAFVAAGFITAASAADNAKLLVGKWEAVKVDANSLPKGSVVEFTADGKIKVIAKKEDKEQEVSGTYTVDGDTFTFKLNIDSKEITQKITIKKLTETELDTLSEEGKAITFKRVK